ncbi:MAG: hypothetical protein OXH19_08455 [Chloroflexi bacterium]|nr:hypothetical protein [Chloroflexota bacterium]MCY3588583.1 hypothetical protein [Chloroflexota bacterium]MCY3685627.1 hypothetical protein [Chloroflexota bacterium]MDE2708529.1 hypothetical protein [Chloroflexota bacterium]
MHNRLNHLGWCLAGQRWRLLVAVAASALLLSACATTSDDEQQQVAQQEQQQAESAADSTSSGSTTTASRSSGSSTSGSAGAAQAAQVEQEQQQAQAQAVVESEEEAQADEEPAQQQADDGMGGMEGGMSVGIIEAAAYDDLSPRLQLLLDWGYPVYVSGDEYTIALGTPDLSPGLHRISLVIEGPAGLVETPAMRITVLPDDAPGEMEEVVARFSRFPDGVRGFHVTYVEFASVGRWNLILHIPSEDGFEDIGIAIDIPEDTAAPSVGDAAPASQSRTITDVANIEDLSTGDEPDPGLYLVSLADAVEAGKPLVVVFASPGFCTNAFCGPQAEVLSELRSIYGDAANYVHVDLYENPAEVKLGADPIETPILEEWGLHTGEWTFVVNADGVVAARFEAFAPLDEVETALAIVLEG